MIRRGKEYIDSIRDGGQAWMNGERVNHMPTYPAFKSMVDVRAMGDRKKEKTA